MPSRGYRKGISDDKQASPKRVHTRLPNDVHAALMADARARHTSACDILRALAIAHTHGARLQLPHPRVNKAAHVTLNRIGNNVNQLAKQAHLARLPLLEADARACLAVLTETLRRLPL